MMRTYGGTTMTEPSGPSNRRQPVRQTRTNPSRVSTNATLALNSIGDPPDGANEETPGFYPAITHFTDAITALPKEMIRHFQMLKEVDAKVYGPEENLSRLLSAGLKAPVPKSVDPTIEIEPLPGPESPDLKHPRFARRAHFLDVRRELAGLLMTLDEKNHVMNTAHDALEKQLKRCQSSFPHIEDEISEEARLGSMTHWAYNSEKPTEKKGMMAGERTRRAANHAAAVEIDASAMRSEPRREAVPSRKSRLQNQGDSDFDESRTYAGKKTQNGNKSRRMPDGLGISNVPVPNNKRRKVEQPPSGGFPMGRSMSSVYASGARGSSPAVDSKKKARGSGPVAASNGKRRANGNTTGLNSPSASSPVIGTFPPSKDHNGRSPALSTAQRNTSSRTQQNLTHPRPTQLSRNRSSSTTNSHRRVSAANGNGATDNHTALPNHSSTSLDKLSTLTGKSTGDVRTTMRESLNAKGEHMVEDTSIGNDGSTDMRGALVVGSADQPKENGTAPPTSNNSSNTTTSRTTRPDRPPSIALSTRGNGHNSTTNTTSTKSKTATPVTATFSSTESKLDQQRPSRPPRGGIDLPAKRSHKKGAGIQAQLAAAAAAAAKGGTKGSGGGGGEAAVTAAADEVDDEKMDGVEVGGEEERGEGEGSGEGGEEPRYCYCGDVSYGEMVGCDADDCSREWFHLSCVGLSRAPARTAKWYCDECKENLRRR